MGINNFLLTLENVLPYSCGQKRCFGGTLGYSIRNFFKLKPRLKPFFEKEYIVWPEKWNWPMFSGCNVTSIITYLLILSSCNSKSNRYILLTCFLQIRSFFKKMAFCDNEIQSITNYVAVTKVLHSWKYPVLIYVCM